MILQVDKLHKQFGGVHAVSGVDLSVAANRIHAIIGPNGAGKTTLAAQIAGAIRPDSGVIRFHGQDITPLSMHKRARLGLARSFQITSVVLPMTLLENVMLAAQAAAGHFRGCWTPLAQNAVIRERAMAVLASVGLSKRAGLLAAMAAHGEQRRLELAMVLALKPKLLLLDEPMAGLGKLESGRMIELLAALKGRAAVLLIEHDMAAVFRLADRVSVLVNGRIIASGGVDEIRGNAEVQRAYLGDAPK